MAAQQLHLVCLENVNSAQVTTQTSSRPDPETVVETLCLHETFYHYRDIYPAVADSTNPVYQQIVKPHMRQTLGLWMCQVCVFREVDVFPVAIDIADRFFALVNLTDGDKIQLVGAASLHLASKWKETSPMTTEDVLYYTDDAYTPSNLQDMEAIILSKLGFDLFSVRPGHFLDAFVSLLEVPVDFHDRVKDDTLRRINIALIETDLLSVNPSAIAAGCLIASLSCAGLSVDATLLENLCHSISCEQSKLVLYMNKSIESWNKHFSAVYAATPEEEGDKSETEEESDDEDVDEDDSDSDMDEGLVVDCGGRGRRELVSSGPDDYLMDSDSGIQEDFLSSQSSSDSSPRRQVHMPADYYGDSDDANCVE